MTTLPQSTSSVFRVARELSSPIKGKHRAKEVPAFQYFAVFYTFITVAASNWLVAISKPLSSL
jgi:hypothetical protein